jgi:hypothetical protein
VTIDTINGAFEFVRYRRPSSNSLAQAETGTPSIFTVTGTGEIWSDSGVTGAKVYADSTIFTGASGIIKLSAGSGAITTSGSVFRFNGNDTLQDNKGIVPKAVYVGRALTLNGAASTTISGAGTPLTLDNNARLTANVNFAFRRSTSGAVIALGTSDTINGTGSLTIGVLNGTALTFPAFTYTGSGGITIDDVGASVTSSLLLTGAINVGTMVLQMSADGATHNILYDFDAQNITSGSLRVGSNGATGTVKINWGSGTHTCTDFNSATINTGTTYDSLKSCTIAASGNVLFGSNHTYIPGTSLIKKTGATGTVTSLLSKLVYDLEIAKTASAVDSIVAGDSLKAHNLTITSGKFRQPANSPIILSGNLVVTTTDTNSRRGECSIAGDATFAAGAVNSDSVAVMRFTGAGNSVLTCNGTKRANLRLVKSATSATLTLADSLRAKSLIDSVGAVKASTKAADVDTLYVGDTGCTFARLYVRHVLVIDKPITITGSAVLTGATVSVSGTGAILASTCAVTVAQGTGDAVPVTYPAGCGVIIKRAIRGFAARFRWGLFHF